MWASSNTKADGSRHCRFLHRLPLSIHLWLGVCLHLPLNTPLSPQTVDRPLLLRRSPGSQKPIRSAKILQLITKNLSDVLQLEVSKIRNDVPFADYGVTSIMGINLMRTVSEALGIELDPIMLFEYTTVDETGGLHLHNLARKKSRYQDLKRR